MKILLLEDNPIHEGMLGDELEDSGCEVQRANSLGTAQRTLLTFPADLLILDLVIAEDHTAVINWAKRLRESSPFMNTPIIFATAYRRSFEKETAEIAFSSVLEKPFSFDELWQRIHAMLPRLDDT